MDREQVAGELERAARWAMNWRALIDDLTIEPPERRKIAAAFHHLALEHHAAIAYLIHGGIHGAAFALFRSQFDAFTRGVWIRACASEKFIKRFLQNGGRPPDLMELIRQIERKEDFWGNDLGRFYEMAYGMLCDFTHGGATQIRARVNDGKIEQAWAHAHVAALLLASSRLSYLGCIEFARLVDDAELASSFAERHRAIYEA